MKNNDSDSDIKHSYDSYPELSSDGSGMDINSDIISLEQKHIKNKNKNKNKDKKNKHKNRKKDCKTSSKKKHKKSKNKKQEQNKPDNVDTDTDVSDRDDSHPEEIPKMKKSDILKELMRRQLKRIPPENKLSYSDLERLVKRIGQSIFDKKHCCVWQGYITNSNSQKKVQYINFYFKGKKTALHRVLYNNFVKRIKVPGYITFSCPSKGKCCNVNHMIFKKYSTNKDSGSGSESESNDSGYEEYNSESDSNSYSYLDVDSDKESNDIVENHGGDDSDTEDMYVLDFD